MAANPENANLLEKVESSDFVICLDDQTPVTRDEGSRACWHGDGRNRFFDKPLQFIVFENGKAGFMGEVSEEIYNCTHTQNTNVYISILVWMVPIRVA